jgi:hypothetical protein
VITDWRLPVPPSLTEDLFWQAAGPLTGEDEPSAVMLAGRPVAAADGMLVNLADTPANRAFFGTTGTADGSSPFPQLRIVAVTARAGRARLGAILGQAGAGEQTLLKRLVKRRPELFEGLVICFDRNFPGHDLILAIVQAGGSPALRGRPRPRLAARRIPHDLAQRPVREKSGHDVRLGVLATMVFATAAQARFAAGWSRADVIRYVAQVRTRYGLDDLSPSLAEDLLTVVLGNQAPPAAADVSDTVYVQLALLKSLTDGMGALELDRGLDEAHGHADSWLRQRSPSC